MILFFRFKALVTAEAFLWNYLKIIKYENKNRNLKLNRKINFF